MARTGGDLRKQVRGRVIAALHAGHLHPGDRLPSVRDLAGDLGEDPRAVLRVYRELEGEGLVEIRTRSGVYLARQEQVAPQVGWETSRWVAADVLGEAWHRRIRVPDLPDFLRRCTASVRVRCACVDRVEDPRVALAHEIAEDFGMETTAVALGPGSAGLEDALRGYDLVVTTTFCAAEVRPVAERLGAPLVVMTMNPLGREEIERHQRRGPVTFLVLDPGFEERLRLVFGEEIRVVRAGDAASAEALLGSEAPVVVSRAASLRMRDRLGSAVLLPQTPVISPETARELAHWLVQLNLRATAETEPGDCRVA